MRHSSLPVFASCAVTTQESRPASGWHWRPVITLPLAMIGPPLVGARLFGVEHLRFPHELAGLRVERVDEVVRARVDDRRCPTSRSCGSSCGRTPSGACGWYSQIRSPVVASTAWMLSPGFGMIHHAVVHERRAFLVARADEPRVQTIRSRATLRAIDLVERAVAPAVERAPPHQPVARIRLLQHRVGHRHGTCARSARGRSRRRRQSSTRTRQFCSSTSAWVFLRGVP